ncbi:CoA transferase [Streptomyces sp. NPDC001292]|uniref:CoA transferase n=1 Tax=Streptomyces sp. NPDC001292 TaxID=3364558 RepID=UPI0036D0AEC4
MITWSPESPAELTGAWARSGAMWLTGHRTGAPLVPVGEAASLAAWLAAHIEQAGAEAGRPVRVDGGRLLAERAALTGGTRQGRVSVGGGCQLLPTADGWAAVSCVRPDDPELWSALIEHELDERLWQRLATWLAGHTKAELEERVTLLGLAAGTIQGLPEAGTARMPRPGRPRSMRGMMVVDFSALWAGPLCAHLLGLAGAEVIKVEVPSRPDGARFGNQTFYDLLHAGHRAVALDPADRAGREALHALVRTADVVIEASRPRALARFGLDALEEVERGCTWVSITAYGRSVDRVGFGDDLAVAGGLLARDDQGAPTFCGDAIADPLTGLTAAALTMSEPEGKGGVLWEVAMADVVAATVRGHAAPMAHVVPSGYGNGWEVDTGRELVSVAAPVARTPTGTAPALGADTGLVLRRLGIAAP